MKKIHLILSILALLVVACSTTSLLPAAAPTVSAPASLPTETHSAPVILPTETPPFTSTSTTLITPTQSTPILTSSPAFTSTASTPNETMPPLTTTVQAASTQTPSTPQGPAFASVAISATQMNWGDTCDTNSVTITAQASSAYNITSMLLFTRLQSLNGNVPTVWNKAVSMHNDGLGTFTYDISTEVIMHYQDYNQAWIQYQLVAYNMEQQEVARTKVYENNLTLARCP